MYTRTAANNDRLIELRCASGLRSLRVLVCNFKRTSAVSGVYIGYRGPHRIVRMSKFERSPAVLEIRLDECYGPMPRILLRFVTLEDANLCKDLFAFFMPVPSGLSGDSSAHNPETSLARPNSTNVRPVRDDPNAVNKVASKSTRRKRR